MSASWYSFFHFFGELANTLTTFLPVDALQRAGIAPRDPTPPPPDYEPVNELVDQLVDERRDVRNDEAIDAPASGPQPDEPVDEPTNGTVDEGLGIIRVNEFINGHIGHQADEPVPEHKKLFDVKEEKKIILNENDNSDDEDREREKFLLVSC
jgi:hypothetical protein